MFNRGVRRTARPDPRKGSHAAHPAGTGAAPPSGADPARPAGAGAARPAEAEAALLRQIDSALELLVSGSLRQADQAAQRGDYEEALAWLQTIDAVALPASYEAKRGDWVRALSTH